MSVAAAGWGRPASRPTGPPAPAGRAHLGGGRFRVAGATDTVAFTDCTPVAYNRTVTATADGLVLRRAGATITIRWGSARPATLSTSNRTYLADATRRVHVLRIPHQGDIDVTITV